MPRFTLSAKQPAGTRKRRLCLKHADMKTHLKGERNIPWLIRADVLHVRIIASACGSVVSIKKTRGAQRLHLAPPSVMGFFFYHHCNPLSRGRSHWRRLQCSSQSLDTRFALYTSVLIPEQRPSERRSHWRLSLFDVVRFSSISLKLLKLNTITLNQLKDVNMASLHHVENQRQLLQLYEISLLNTQLHTTDEFMRSA